MNRRNPIDNFFGRKLQYYSVDPPMELWDRIDAERTLQKKETLQIQKQRAGVLLLLLAGLSVSTLWWFSSGESPSPALRSFPVEMRKTTPSSEIPVAEAAPAAIPPAIEAEPLAVRQVFAEETAQSQIVHPLPDLPEEAVQLIERPSVTKSPVAVTSDQQVVAGLAALPQSPSFPKIKSLFSEDVKCAEFNPDDPGKWTLDILASPDWSFRRLEPKTREYAEYVQNRKKTETPDFNYSAGLRVSYTHPSGFLGRIGLNYSQINEKFEHRTESEEVITIRNIFGPGGDVIGTDTLVETKIHRIFSNNRFESLDIPVILGYEKNFKKLALTVNAGLLFNVSFRSKGDFISPMDGEPVSFDDSEPDSYPAFRDKLGVGIYAGVTLAYPISPKLQLIAEPHLKTYPQTITRDQYMVSQTYLLTGLSVGLRHQL